MTRLPALLFILLLAAACKQHEEKQELYPATSTEETAEQRGQSLFDGPGNCVSCHRPDQKIIGPSLQDIASIYKQKNGNMVSFLRGKEEPIVDPSQFEVMKTNFAITKKMSEQDLRDLEAYIYSFLQK